MEVLLTASAFALVILVIVLSITTPAPGGITTSEALPTPSAALSTPLETVMLVDMSEIPSVDFARASSPSSEPTIAPTPVPTPTPVPEPEILYTEEDLQSMALTIAGECYDYETQDKYNVAWTIINRVRDGGYGGDTVLQVVSSTQWGVQFVGYWKQYRPVSEGDYDVARDVLTSYYAGEDAPVDYLAFRSGGGTTNVFR
jgi:hypothetical protein